MNAIIVDDEKLALAKLESILKSIDYIEYVYTYSNPFDALERIFTDNADIAFLDIEMPRLNGLELAERLTELKPSIQIVFVTAYDKYALQAFKVYALGYILKPHQREDIVNQLQILDIRNKKNIIKQNNYFIINTFGAFTCCIDDEDKKPIHFRTEKAEELLIFLLHQKGKAVQKDIICDTLWPKMDTVHSTKNFYTTCYYLRKLFAGYGIPDIIKRRSNTYYIDNKLFITDFDLLESAVKINKAEVDIDFVEKTIMMYNGSFLNGKDYIWCSELQTYYERCFEKTALYLTDKFLKADNIPKAETVLVKILSHIPFCEVAFQSLLNIYSDTGRRSAVLKMLKEFTNKYTEEFGEPPDICINKSSK